MASFQRFRHWLRGGSARARPERTPAAASRASLGELEAFARSRRGVEAYLEPRTAIYPPTLLLIADDGEYLRRAVKDGAQARRFATEANIPLYDARKVGYPKRLREYEQGVRPRRIELSELPPWPTDDAPGIDGPPPPPPPHRRAPPSPEGD